MSWTTPGQGYYLKEANSQYKFRMQSGKQVGLGPAVGLELDWNSRDKESIQIKAPEPLSPAHKLAIKHVTSHFRGLRKIKVNGTVVDPGRKGNYDKVRPNWGSNFVPQVGQ